jgi:hypothetical protein
MKLSLSFKTYFPKAGLCDLHAACLCIHHQTMPEPILMKRGISWQLSQSYLLLLQHLGKHIILKANTTIEALLGA